MVEDKDIDLNINNLKIHDAPTRTPPVSLPPALPTPPTPSGILLNTTMQAKLMAFQQQRSKAAAAAAAASVHHHHQVRRRHRHLYQLQHRNRGVSTIPANINRTVSGKRNPNQT